ncbi:hypothetical protein LguiB_002700 [Lonicera macranthoides]
MSSGARVSIPNNVRKMIHNIKEITGNHSEEEIYAMLKECSMDPNETTQKLLLQDTFHEVKRKRDRRKENLSKEPAESRWKPGMQGRGNRGGRGNYLSRQMSHDAVGGKNSASGKENGISLSEGGVGLSTMPSSQDKKHTEATFVASSSTAIADDPTVIASESTSKLQDPVAPTPPIEANKNPTIAFGTGDTHGTLMPSSRNMSDSRPSAPPSGVYFSASDPVLVPSQESRVPSAVGAIRREVGSHRTPVGQDSVTPVERKSTAASSEVGSSFVQGKTPSKSQGVGKNQLSESFQPAPSTHNGSSVSRPSSNYSNRPQQVIGPQKGGPSKEWKPKPTNPNLAQGSGTVVSSEVLTVPDEVNTQSHSQPTSNSLDSNESASELERKLENSYISDSQHVIIPNHLHVPEVEKLGFCFGSFDASFGLNTPCTTRPESDKSQPLSETSEGIDEESTEEQSLSNQIALGTAEEGDYPDCPPSSSHVPENLSSTEVDVSSSVVPEYNEPKQETNLPPGGHQYSVVHTSPNYSFGFMPPMLGNQLAPFEGTESQARDVSRLPSFVVQQPFDPANYYAQFYRSGADNDGRISPFHSPGVATKYNGNVAVLSPQAPQVSQELMLESWFLIVYAGMVLPSRACLDQSEIGGNPLVLSTAGPTPLATQAAGVMQSSIAVSQQPLPVFRQPPGVHLPHYAPNYIPYGHYISPFYMPPPAIHQFLSNGAYPQQPQGGGVYPAPPVAATKYSHSQYKPGSNTANSTHIGSYGPYGSSTAGGYNPSSAAAAGNSTSNEELAGSQFKESNVYITGQQSEGSGVWIAAPARDISGLQASSFYNLPQGQVAFTPTQAGGHGTFAAGIYHHPAQSVTAPAVHPLLQQSQPMAGPVDLVGSTASVYQQPQPAQINWPNNY